MFSVGSIRTLIIDSVESNKIQLDLNGFLQNVVLNDLNSSGTCKSTNYFSLCSGNEKIISFA